MAEGRAAETFVELGKASVAPVTVPDNVQRVADACVALFGDNVRAILWHGSRARGEAGEASDDDLILLFHTVDNDLLLRLRELFRGLAGEKWSTYVVSDAEFRHLPPGRRLRFAHGFHVLHGEFEPLPLSRADVLAELRLLARDISYQCRDRLIHKQKAVPTMYRMAKKAVFAMQARHLLNRGSFPETRAALLPFLTDPDERTIVDWVARWQELRPGFERDPVPLMLHLDTFARRLIESLPEG